MTWWWALILLAVLVTYVAQAIVYARLAAKERRADLGHRARMSQFDTTSSERVLTPPPNQL